jgi:hypothetical protein
MVQEDLNKLNEQAKHIFTQREEETAAWEKDTFKLCEICAAGLVKPPIRRLLIFKRCPICGNKLNKRVRTICGGILSKWEATRLDCNKCDYSWVTGTNESFNWW